jgi:hypothetical protein
MHETGWSQYKTATRMGVIGWNYADDEGPRFEDFEVTE